MFVYIGVDEESKAFKVGITKLTAEERLKTHNLSQEHFYFKEYFSKEFSEASAKHCEKQVLKHLRKKYDHVEVDGVGKTETFQLGDLHEEGLGFALKFITDFKEEDKAAYDKILENKKKYDFSDFNRFKEYVGTFCANCSFPLTERVTLNTLRKIHEADMANKFTYACSKENKNWALERFAQEFVSRRTTELIESIGEGEEHF